ncbi:winged helix-turn-helix transcriptional regulator [Streptomyces sp. NPDC058371]|uniref:winged helix-turn-helix transcriptional regulator n=1 Tax=Streptomyces sp. NPDC058371 TaxID=3346463 RepID=UPI00365F4105
MTEQPRIEQPRAEPSGSKPSRSKPSRSEPSRTEPSRTESSGSEPSCVESSRAGSASAELPYTGLPNARLPYARLPCAESPDAESPGVEARGPEVGRGEPRPGPAGSLDADMFDPLCPSGAMPFRVGDKWTGMAIRCLEAGPRRFTELRVPLPVITPKVLSQTLRAMERDGLITRTAYDENPPRVEYALTPLGHTLIPLLDAARAWSAEHLPRLLTARRTHEAAP